MKDWNGDSIWNYGTNLSKVVSVLFNKNVAFRPMAKDHIENGRVLSLKIEINDHKIQIINIYKSLNGPGIWKMNAQTIQTHAFRESLEKLWPTWTDKINEYENILLWWEITKINIKQLTIEIRKTLNTSIYEINKIEKRLNEIRDSDKFIHKSQCISLKHTIKEYYEKQTEAAKIRSRVKNFEEGEKSTRYFFNLEKHNISNKIWTKIKCKDGTLKTDIRSILREQTTFFKELFTSDGIDVAEADTLLSTVDAKLTDEEREFCEKDVSTEETFKIIKQLKSNKSPGDDGIIAEFYKTYNLVLGAKGINARNRIHP